MQARVIGKGSPDQGFLERRAFLMAPDPIPYGWLTYIAVA